MDRLPSSEGAPIADDSLTQADLEKVSSDAVNAGPAPDGGLEAWLVAAGASCILFSTLVVFPVLKDCAYEA